MTERSFSCGNSFASGNSPTAGTPAQVIPEQEIRGAHWWHWR